MNLIIFLPVFVLSFVPGSENLYENIVLEPTNPFYKEQFQINQDDYQTLDDALGFGFWSQFRPYQEILASPYVDKEFQPSANINGQLMFSIRNIDTNQFETVYYLYYPLFNDIVVHQLAQQNQNYCSFLYFYSFTNRYEGIWVYTHLQFIPLRSYINVNFITYASWQQKKVDFKIYKYGNKEIIIGGKGKILNFLNLEEFHGRMSRPIQFQKELLFQGYQFLDHYFQLHTPKSCASQIKIDIQKDLLYMDSKMQINQKVQMHENAYAFGGWVKVDFTNIHYSQGMPLIRGTINKDYQNFYFYGDRSFLIEYWIDTYRNVSTIKLETYSYKIPQKGLIIQSGGLRQSMIFVDFYQVMQNGIQKWHYIKYTYGIFIQDRKEDLVEVFLPDTKQIFSYYFFKDFNQTTNQFTSDYMYLFIGADKYQIYSQFKGWIRDFQIWTCLDSNSTIDIRIFYNLKFKLACHYTCQQTPWCSPEKCEQCPTNSHRKFINTTKQCECEVGYYPLQNQTICNIFQDNFKFLQFSQLNIVNPEQCQYGYYQQNNNCYQCPSNIRNTNKISCLECISSKLSWYLNPICQTDYIKFIGNPNEPFYSMTREINDIELFKIDSQQYLELCVGCQQYCDSLITGCNLSNNYHLGEQMKVVCKQNYFFHQNTKLCTKCQTNCEICDSEGKCLQCEKQHYLDPVLQQCLQCDIRCSECQFDPTLNQQVCTDCPQDFTLSNGKCLKCGFYCKFCQEATNTITGEIYPRCFQCIDNSKYFISFDAKNCHINKIENCIYAFQYFLNDRHITTIDMLFEPRILDSTIITACAKCSPTQAYVISEQICIATNNMAVKYAIKETRQSELIYLSAGPEQNYTSIQTIDGGMSCAIYNCGSCMYFKTFRMPKCSQCDSGFYLQLLRGNCIQCPAELNSLVCRQQQKFNKDYFKQEFLAFYEFFVNFDGTHDYFEFAQTSNSNDFEIVSTVCYSGSQPIDGKCVKDCAENCAECTYKNGQFQCLRCYETNQGIMLTLVDKECIQCPFNCAVCLPQDTKQIFQYNPYFNNKNYQYFTHVCLQPIQELQKVENYFLDPEIGHYVECIESKGCQQEVQFEITVHCNDSHFDKLFSSSPNPIEFKQQNIKLSQLFSGSNQPHLPEYQNDVVYKQMNEKSVKTINQTFIFSNISECIISEASILQNQFRENVYSLKWVYVNLVAVDDNVQVYLSNSLQFHGFTHVNIYNMELISLAENSVNLITFTDLIKTNIQMTKITLSSKSKNSTISFNAYNSSSIIIQDCQIKNLRYQSTNFINIQHPIWNFEGIISFQRLNNHLSSQNLNLSELFESDSRIVMSIQKLKIINCTFKDSNIIYNLIANEYYFTFNNIEIYAEFFNSRFLSDAQLYTLQRKTSHFKNIQIESSINSTEGFFNFEDISNLTIDQLVYKQSIITNSIFIMSNSQFSFNFLTFLNLQIIGKSTLIKYKTSDLVERQDIEISSLTITNVSYEQIYSFLYLIHSGVNNQVKISQLSLENNYLNQEVVKTNLRLYYYSSLIYIEMSKINIINVNIYRMPGYYEFAFVNTKNITVNNLTINQKEQIKGLHQYLDCQQNQGIGNQYYSVISIYKAMQTILNQIYANNLVLYNYPLVQYQSTDLSEKSEQELFILTNSIFTSIIIIITVDIKSASIISIESGQSISINIINVQFSSNQLNAYIKGNFIHSCLINLQCFNGTVVFDQLNTVDNLVTNSTFALFYLNAKTLTIQNSIFLRSNIFNYQKVKKHIMQSFPKDNSWITIESLQESFPIISSGVFQIKFDILRIDDILIETAQGCKGGGFQLDSKNRGIFILKNSNFINITPSLNCVQSFGGVFYLDTTSSELFLNFTKIYLNKVMSLNQGGFIYLLSEFNQVSITISQVEATNYQSLQGSFIYASISQSQTVNQKINIFNCSLTNTFQDFIQYLGYLSTFQIDQTNVLIERVQFYVNNYQFQMKYITISVLNYEQFIRVSNCKQIELTQIYFGSGNYSSSPLFNIQFQAEQQSKLFIDNIYIQDLEFIEDTMCENLPEYNIKKLTFLCQQDYNTVLPLTLEQTITTDFLMNRGKCYLNKVVKNLNQKSFSLIKISNATQQHQIRINKINFSNIKCTECQNGLLNLNFESGVDNLVQIINLMIFNSSCGNLGCVLLSSGSLDQSILIKNNRQLNTLERDYIQMNYTIKISGFTCLNNIATFGVCLFINNVELQVIDSYFSNNCALSSGGAIYSTNMQETISLIRTVSQNNSAYLGNSIIYQNAALPNITQTQSVSILEQNKSDTNYFIETPQKIKITKFRHSYFYENQVIIQNSTLKIDLSMFNDPFQLPNGQALSTYQYYDLKIDQYVPLNLSLRLVALNIYDQEQIKLQGSICEIYSRIVQNLEDETEFSQNYTSPVSIEFNTTSKDYDLDSLILYFPFSYDELNPQHLQLQFKCDSIKVPVYSESDQYNIEDWHTSYYLRTSLIKPFPCQIGEIRDQTTQICHLCDSSSEFYSVKFDSSKCESKNELTMISVTSAQINLKEFYWRPYVTSNLIENCFNLQQNCQGGWEYGDNSCFVGHIGALCEQCDLYNIRGDGQYSISNPYTCGSCQSIGQNILIISLASIFTLISIIISVNSTDDLVTDLSKWTKHMTTGILVANNEAISGILLKILTNYLQIAGSLSTFKLSMPIWINQVIVTSSDPISSMAYSLDCFLIDMFPFPILYGRILWHIIMLSIYMLAAIILFYFLKRITKLSFSLGNLSTILIYTFVFLQPNIIKSVISSISYRYISGYTWVQGHVAYRYDSDSHQNWLYYLISMLIFIGILIPLYFYYKLNQIKHKLNTLYNRAKWGYLYNEYTKWAYYWEIVKIFLKELIIIMLTYYEDQIFLKAVLINLGLIVYQHCLVKWKPYNLSFLNQLDDQSTKTCSISMIIGFTIYMSQQQNINEAQQNNYSHLEIQYPFFLILFILNMNFLRKIIFKILIAYSDKFQLQIDKIKAMIRYKFPKLVLLMPSCAKYLESTIEKKNQIKSTFRKIVRKILQEQKLSRGNQII